MKRVLIIEDDHDLLMGLRDNLELEGYEVRTADNGRTGISEAIEGQPNAVILDIMLPGLSGFEVCRSLRDRGVQVPILMLTAKAQEIEKILGFELGADDYVTKPFSIKELLARLRALIRRTTLIPVTDRYQFADVELDFRRHRARKGAQALAFSALEFAVMRYLIGRRGEAVSREQLLCDVWGHRSFLTTRSVDNLVVRLRHKLEDSPHEPQHLLTVHGTGYMFVD